jgi:hypothetical protein
MVVSAVSIFFEPDAKKLNEGMEIVAKKCLRYYLFR